LQFRCQCRKKKIAAGQQHDADAGWTILGSKSDAASNDRCENVDGLADDWLSTSESSKRLRAFIRAAVAAACRQPLRASMTSIRRHRVMEDDESTQPIYGWTSAWSDSKECIGKPSELEIYLGAAVKSGGGGGGGGGGSSSSSSSSSNTVRPQFARGIRSKMRGRSCFVRPPGSVWPTLSSFWDCCHRPADLLPHLICCRRSAPSSIACISSASSWQTVRNLIRCRQ
jgi:hypothetical protein